MASSYTSLLGLEKPAYDEQPDTWGDTLDRQYDLIDQAIAGMFVLDVSAGGPFTLTSSQGATDQSRYACLSCIGTMAANATVVLPRRRPVLVFNQATGALVTLRASGSGATIVLGNGEGGLFYVGANDVLPMGGITAVLNRARLLTPPSANDDSGLVISSAWARDLFRGANVSLAIPGFSRLPSGLIEKWGIGATVGGGAVVTFATAFPTACIGAWPMVMDATGLPLPQLGVGALLPTGFNVYSQNVSGGAVSTNFRWRALGY